ncbi:HEAT repeat domain-containing protein [Kribbella sp. NPDC004536]|uniref:HEAT repeat domain-containing protein n=1 Tax=Kribbella sp. NPDC004536 TaxID=3364106 RepID=UPI003686CD32
MSFYWEGRTPGDPELDRALADLTDPDGAYLQAFTTLLHSRNIVAQGIALDHSEVRRAVTGFHSRHWIGRELRDPELRGAHEVLQFGFDRDAFLTLLYSDDPMAVGVALDHFKNAAGWDLDEEPVLRRAYAVLRETAVAPDAANHLSALDVVVADVADPDLVVNLLEHTQSAEVREQALWAANRVLLQATDPRLIDVVARLAEDSEHRTRALRVLAGAAGPAADPVLLRALESDEPAVRLEVAWQLAQPGRIDQHRDLLTRAVDNLPADSNRSRLLVSQIRKRLLP